MKYNHVKCIVFLIFFNIPFSAYSAVINANSCSYPDVQAAIAAASSGDTVNMPTCSSPTWTSRLEITKQNLTIKGQGIANTTINGFGFLISTASSGAKITGIHFNAGSNVPVIRVSSGSDYSGTPVTGWMIDGNKFTSTGGNGTISVFNGSSGIISNNEFYDTNTDATIYTWGRDDPDWALPSFLGKAGPYVFIEDNLFVSTSTTTNHAILSSWGASYTFRCNKVTDSGGSNTWKDIVDVHGYGHGTNRRGGRAVEAYGNYFNNRNYSYRSVNLRSGTGRVFANRWVNANTFIGLTDYRMINQGLAMAYPTNPSDCTTNSANCSSTAEATCCTDHEGYPCCDQIGTGQDIGGANRQESAPYYFWDNKTTDGGNINVTVASGSPATLIQQNRDYFVGSPPAGYAPYTYPHPGRGIAAAGQCLTGANSAADTGIVFWSSEPAVPNISIPNNFQLSPVP